MAGFEALFWLFFLGLVAYFAWQFIRSGGSLVGALLGGRVTRTVGEIELQSSTFSSRTLKVHVIEQPSQTTPQVALALVSKAPFGASMVPIALTQLQAKRLASLLEQAAR
jgi:hypothetical protein